MKATLSPAVIVDAGDRLARRDGVNELGVRGIAAELGVTPMALYRHVGNGQELHEAVLRSLLTTLPVPAAEGAPADRFRSWATEAREMLRAVPGLAHYLLLHWFELEAATVVVEALLGVSRDAGFEGFACVAVANSVFMYVLMRVEAEAAVAGTGVEQRRLRPLEREPARFPLMTRYETEYTTARLDIHFTYGLDALLRGLLAEERQRQ